MIVCCDTAALELVLCIELIFCYWSLHLNGSFLNHSGCAWLHRHCCACGSPPSRLDWSWRISAFEAVVQCCPLDRPLVPFSPIL